MTNSKLSQFFRNCAVWTAIAVSATAGMAYYDSRPPSDAELREKVALLEKSADTYEKILTYPLSQEERVGYLRIVASHRDDIAIIHNELLSRMAQRIAQK